MLLWHTLCAPVQMNCTGSKLPGSNCLSKASTFKATLNASLKTQIYNILPLSVYHFGLPMNSLTSRTILSATLSSRTTELRGLRLRGNPNGRHSAPMAVYMTVRPSSCFSASSLAARHKWKLSVDEYMKQAHVQSLACDFNEPCICVKDMTFLQDVEENLSVSA